MGLSITSDDNFIDIGNKSIVKANILFLDHDQDKVYIILSGRKPGHATDTNDIAIDYKEVDDPDTYESAAELQTYLKTLF